MRVIIALALYILYWGICYLGTGTERKNLSSLSSYSDEVQRRVKEQFLGNIPRKKSLPALLLGNLLLFTLIFLYHWLGTVGRAGA